MNGGFHFKSMHATVKNIVIYTKIYISTTNCTRSEYLMQYFKARVCESD